MLNKEEPAWKKLCKECSSAAKEVGITKADTDRIIKETREMLWKSNKYDELIEKLKKESGYFIKEAGSYVRDKATVEQERLIAKFEYAQKILSFLKGE